MPEGHTIHRLAAALSELYAGRRLAVSSPQGRFAAGAARLNGLVLLGAILSATGYGPMYAGLAVVVVVAGVFYHAVHGRHQAARRRQVA